MCSALQVVYGDTPFVCVALAGKGMAKMDMMRKGGWHLEQHQPAVLGKHPARASRTWVSEARYASVVALAYAQMPCLKCRTFFSEGAGHFAHVEKGCMYCHS
jgi:hypothetical protein